MPGRRRALKPVHIWNDGQATYFAFASGLRPSIFGVDATGREVTLNSGTRGSIVRVSGLRSAYSIRIGGRFCASSGWMAA